ncbi:MAG: hypothetical protein CTY16_14430 [Methylobacter sp.]|nr:MAG: hypothetical protein CTY16_14430 [Methylobacter sp.]
MAEKHIYKVTLVNHEQIFEVYVKSVYQGELYGFVVIEDFVFDEKNTLVVDPFEEKLRAEFEGVERSFIPAHKIIRIDQVQRRGKAKIVEGQKGQADGVNKISMLFRPDKN